jgi:hypothetical protein
MRAAPARILLEVTSRMQRRPPPALREARLGLRLCRCRETVNWPFIHASRLPPFCCTPGLLTACCPADLVVIPATRSASRNVHLSPTVALSSLHARAPTPLPAVARTPGTKSRRQTTLLALQHSAVPPPVAQGRSHHLLCLLTSAQLLLCPPHLVPSCLKSPHCTLFPPHARSRSKTPGTFCSFVTSCLRSWGPLHVDCDAIRC